MKKKRTLTIVQDESQFYTNKGFPRSLNPGGTYNFILTTEMVQNPDGPKLTAKTVDYIKVLLVYDENMVLHISVEPDEGLWRYAQTRQLLEIQGATFSKTPSETRR